LLLPLFKRPAAYIIAAAPHLRKQSNVGSYLFCFFTVLHSLFQIPLLRTAGSNLKNGCPQKIHNPFPFVFLLISLYFLYASKDSDASASFLFLITTSSLLPLYFSSIR